MSTNSISVVSNPDDEDSENNPLLMQKSAPKNNNTRLSEVDTKMRTFHETLFKWSAKEWQFLVFLLTPIVLLPLPIHAGTKEGYCAYVGLIMAVYWVLETLPLAVTSLMPIVFFPLFSIMDTKTVTQYYMKDTIVLFMGGLIVAIAVESSNLHRRIALLALNLFGASPRKLLIGFMTPTAFLSMFISNTATTAMMIPIVEAVLQEMQDHQQHSLENGGQLERKANTEEEKTNRKSNKTSMIRPMLCMSVCMSANVGGTGTVIGTGPNLVAVELLKQTFGSSQPMTFTTWLAFALPQLILCLICIWIWLQLYYLPNPFRKTSDEERALSKAEEANVAKLLRTKLSELGKMTYYEANVLSLFVFLVLLWFFRSPGFMTGWGDAFDTNISDATAAMFISILLFILPADKSFWSLEKSEKKLLDWPSISKRLAWGIILLFGGGFALGGGSEQSGLSAWIGSQFSSLSSLPVWSIVIICTLGASALTQVAANVASANIFLPIMIQLANTLCVNPLLLILPPTMACSFTFILPVSTAPNAIAYEAAGLKAVEMVKVGWVMNVLSLLITWGCIFTYGQSLLKLDSLPDWASNKFTNCTTHI